MLRNGRLMQVWKEPNLYLVHSTPSSPVALGNGFDIQVINQGFEVDDFVAILECDDKAVKVLNEQHPNNAILPVYRNATHERILLTDQLLLSFAPSCSAETIKQFIPQHKLELVEEMDIGEPLYIVRALGNPVEILIKLWGLYGPRGNGWLLDANHNIIKQFV